MYLICRHESRAPDSSSPLAIPASSRRMFVRSSFSQLFNPEIGENVKDCSSILFILTLDSVGYTAEEEIGGNTKRNDR